MVYTTYKNGDLGDSSLLFYHALPTLVIIYWSETKPTNMIGQNPCGHLMIGSVSFFEDESTTFSIDNMNI